MNINEKILIVDDEKIIRESLFHWFENEGYQVVIAEDGESGLAKFKNEKFDLVLIDMKLPGINGLQLLKEIKDIDSEVIVIMITAFASVPSAITAFKEGAYDYVTKPVDPDELTHIVKKALEEKALKFEYSQLKENIYAYINPNSLIGDSSHIKKIYELIKTVAPSDSTALISGISVQNK